MAELSRVAKAALAAVAGVAYATTILRRNDALVREPVRRADGTPFPQEWFEFSDGAGVSVIHAGEGPAMLWVPGADGVKETWSYQLPVFAQRFTVLAADLRADFSPRDTFDRFVDDIEELIEAYGTGPVVLVGQSLGSAIAIRFAARFPHLLRGLVLANPLARVSYEHVGLNRVGLVPISTWTTRYLPTIMGRAAAALWCRAGVWIYDDSPGRERLIHYALWAGPRTVRAAVSGRRVDLLKGLDLREQLDSIAAPALVVKGPEDAYCPPEWALEIAAGIRGATYTTVPGTGHCGHISMPGPFNRALLDWLEETLETEETGEVAGESDG